MGATTSLSRGGTSYASNDLEYSGLTPGITGTLYHCGLGTPAEFPPGVRGNIALIQRGTLYFSEKVTNAMNAGAKAAIVYNNVAGAYAGTLGVSGNWIPSLAISQADGQALEAALPTTVTLSCSITPSSIYDFLDGTSMAAPFVTAAVAFAARNFPNETAVQRVARIVNHAAPVGYLTGKVRSNGRLDLARIVDTNSNGLPDWWEIDNFGALGVSPTADPDGDGFTNLQEYLIGTRPKDPASRLTISNAEMVSNGANNDFRVTFPTAIGVTYQVERNDTLGVGLWVALGGILSGTGAPASVTDASAVTLHPQRFYRVRIVSP